MKYIKKYEKALSQFILLSNDNKIPRMYEVINRHIPNRDMITLLNDKGSFETKFKEDIENKLLFQSDNLEDVLKILEPYIQANKYNI